MSRRIIAAGLAAAFAGAVFAGEGEVPRGVAPLEHVFVIMLENHGYGQVIGNPNAPFLNRLASSANLAANYYAVGHPSLTNYLEVVGGSNFGVRSDHAPDWHSSSCETNLSTGTAATGNPLSGRICPIAGSGTDAATPAVESTFSNIDGIASFPAARGTLGKSIADQLVAAKRSWKSYQESLPERGADNVDYSDGVFTDHTDFGTLRPALAPPLTQGDVMQLYAVKHNPFVYFRSVQQASDARNSLANSVGFDGAHGLYADLSSGRVPSFSFIAPNLCNDQHGLGNAGKLCYYDPGHDGTQAGMNPALLIRADTTVKKLVGAIERSPAWRRGRNAIVVLWDENDFSRAPNTNRVVLIVETSYGVHGVKSARRYTHFSLLKSLEAGFGLPCLNHACDRQVAVMSDLFGGR